MEGHPAWKYVEEVENAKTLDFGTVLEKSLGDLCQGLEGVFSDADRVWLSASQRLDGPMGEDIAAFLVRLLDSSGKLKELRLKGFQLSRNDWEKIGEGMGRNATLASIEMEDVLLGDASLQHILKSVRQDQLKNIVLKNCGVTDASYGTIIRYIARRHAEVLNFTVEGGEFTRKRDVQDKVMECCGLPEPPTDIAELERENEKLRRRIDSLRNMIDPMISSDCTFVAGPNARKFAKKLNALCRELDGIV